MLRTLILLMILSLPTADRYPIAFASLAAGESETQTVQTPGSNRGGGKWYADVRAIFMQRFCDLF